MFKIAYVCFGVWYYRLRNNGTLAWLEAVFDTGSDLAEETKRMFPSVFNGNSRKGDETPEETLDDRSDNRVG